MNIYLYSMSEAKIGVVTLSHKVESLPMIIYMHIVGVVNSASRSAMIKKSYFCTSTKFHAFFGRNHLFVTLASIFGVGR
jgi:hypothetical protein